MALNKNNFSIRRNERFYSLVLAVGLALLLFGNGINGQFVYDDTWVIGQNPTVGQFGEVFHQLILPYHYLQPETGLYRPLTLIAFTGNYLFGAGPASFHIVNILLHALNSWLILLLIYKLFRSRRLAYLTALIFLFLPIHTEAVSFISGRADLLAFFFSLLALLALSYQRYWLSGILFGLALFSKESALALIPLLAFWFWVYENQNLKASLKRTVYFLPSFGLYLLLRYVALGSNFLANDADPIYNPLKFAGAASRFYTALRVMLLYLYKTFIPTHLSADYSYNQIPLIHSPLDWSVLAGLAVLAVIVWLVVWRRSRPTLWAAGAAIFLASYLIISNFVFPIGTIMAERTFYFPSLGLALIAAAAVDRLSQWRLQPLWLGLMAGVLLFYGWVVIQRNPVWHNRLALYQDMVKTAPDSIHAKVNLAIYYIQNGHWGEGKKLLLATYPLAPEHLPLLDSLGVLAEHEQRWGDAEQFYLRALALRPHYATALSNLGRMYFQRGQYQKAADIYWQEFNYHQQAGAMLVYAMSLSKLGRYDQAIAAVKQYFGDPPADQRLQFALGYAYYKKGDKVTANKYFKDAKNPNLSDEAFIKSIEQF